jgi:hypothetical protein
MLQRTFFLALFLSSAAGCVSDIEQHAAEKVTHPVIEAADRKLGGYSGNWSGTWKAPDGNLHPLHATFSQDGLSVTGTLTFESNACFPNATLRAAVVDEGLNADLEAGGMHLHYAVTYFDGNGMDGELSALEPALCALGQGGAALVHLTRD